MCHLGYCQSTIGIMVPHALGDMMHGWLFDVHMTYIYTYYFYILYFIFYMGLEKTFGIYVLYFIFYFINILFYLGYLKGMVLLRKWRVILVFYCLVFYWVILVCSFYLYFVFFIIFVTEVFERFSGERLSLVMPFYYCFSSKNTLCVPYLNDLQKTSCHRCFDVKHTWSVCRNLAGGFFSTDVF